MDSAAGNPSDEKATSAWQGPCFRSDGVLLRLMVGKQQHQSVRLWGSRGHSALPAPHTCLPLPGQAELPWNPLQNRMLPGHLSAQASGQKPHPHTLPCHEVSKFSGSKIALWRQPCCLFRISNSSHPFPPQEFRGLMGEGMWGLLPHGSCLGGQWLSPPLAGALIHHWLIESSLFPAIALYSEE